MHNFVDPFVSDIFWVLPIAYSQDTHTDVDAKNVKKRGSAQG